MAHQLQLHARELFKHCQRTNKSLPQRGGDKDFAPDDGWLQAKRLEKFLEERNECLSEERVERQGSLVQGEWVPEKQLVELHKEMGKFWAQMGFVDEKRMWLYPEEALYLMETNILEVWYRGLPVSIQQAYIAFLNTDMLDDEYQVYAHLRRLGYVVIRHQGKLPFTKYQRQLGLDKHIKVKSHKRTKQENEEYVKFSSETSSKKMKTEVSGKVLDHPGYKDIKADTFNGDLNINEDGKVELERLGETENHDSISEMPCENQEDIDMQEQQSCNEKTEYRCDNDFTLCQWGSYDNCRYQNHYESQTKYTSWDFESISFPNIASSKNVQLERPSAHLLPSGVDLPKEKYFFNVEHYFRSRSKRSSDQYNDEEDSIYELNFSYAEMIRKQSNVKASNWSEYKVKIQSVDESSLSQSPVSHYLDEKVPPLLQPEDAWSTSAILKKLSVIKNVDEEKDVVLTVPKGDLQKISFDVYLPNAKFKKSQPGIPNLRVIVNKNHDCPPDLPTLTALEKFFDDKVPFHWAVNNDGESAFYKFDSHCVPKLIPLG